MANRDQRRKTAKLAKKQGKTQFNLVDLQKAFSIALEMKKASQVHLFDKIMGERCTFCGKGRDTEEECEYWFLTFLDRVQTILINPDFFTGDDIQAIWLQHAAAYAPIQIPVLKDDDGEA